jgi:hypothetical protein
MITSSAARQASARTESYGRTRRVNLHPSAAKMPTMFDKKWNGMIALPGHENMSALSPRYLQIDPTDDRSRKELAFWCGHALASRHENAMSLENEIRALRHFFRFLDRRVIKLKKTTDLGSHHLHLYLEELRRGKREHRYEARKLAAVTKAFRCIRQFDKSLVQTGLNTSLRLTTRTSRRSRSVARRDEFTLTDKARLEKILLKEMDFVWRRFNAADLIMRKALEMGADPEKQGVESSATLGEVLVRFRYHLSKTKVPSGRAFYKRMGHLWDGREIRNKDLSARLFRAPGLECEGIRDFWELALPSSRTLLPYFLWIGSRTPINTGPLCALRTDCLNHTPGQDSVTSANALDGALRANSDIEYLRFFKGRAKRIQRAKPPKGAWLYEPFLKARPQSSPAVVRQVLDITASAREYAPKSIQPFLFIFHSASGHSEPFSRFFLANARLFLREFRARHNLPTFSISDLRQSHSEASFRVTGGSFKAVQTQLQHSHESTSRDHYKNNGMRRILDKKLSQYVYYLQSVVEKAALSDLTKIEFHGIKLDLRRRVTPPTFSPTSPLAELARQFEFAFGNSRHALNLGEANVEFVAHLLQFTDHLTAQKRVSNFERWEASVGPVVTIIRSAIIPNLDPEVVSAARRHASLLPPLPPFE